MHTRHISVFLVFRPIRFSILACSNSLVFLSFCFPFSYAGFTPSCVLPCMRRLRGSVGIANWRVHSHLFPYLVSRQFPVMLSFLLYAFLPFPSVSVLLIEAEVRLLSFSFLLYFTDMLASSPFS